MLAASGLSFTIKMCMCDGRGEGLTGSLIRLMNVLLYVKGNSFFVHIRIAFEGYVQSLRFLVGPQAKLMNLNLIHLIEIQSTSSFC